LDGEGFLRIDTPIFTPNACEGTTTLFSTEYFGNRAYLSQSGQLYNEATAAAFGKVYCFGPTFRAEKAKTRRHLTEFWMVEPEVAFMDFDGLLDLCEWFITGLSQIVLERCKDALLLLDQTKAESEEDNTNTLMPRIEALSLIKPPLPRIHYDQAIEILQNKGCDIKWGSDLGAEEETILAKEFDKPIMVHHYPAEVKAFYMKKDPNDPKYALGVDILAPEGYGEIIGGGQREDDYQTLLHAIHHHNLPEEAFQWYLDLRRYGTFPHSGFGLGVERAVAWFCGIRHIRETIPFPRTIERLTP
jgi:asparaginyl-tRNA synthetase